MDAAPTPPNPARPRRRKLLLIIPVLVAVAIGVWWWSGAKSPDANAAKKGSAPIPVVTAKAQQRDVAVTLRANGTVVPIQTVDIRAQVTSTVREVHIREGQSVKAGELLFTLDARADEANYKKALAQIEKDKADLATAERNYARQKELFDQKFISQSALDTLQNSVDTLRGQLAVDTAAADAARVAVGYSQIRASFPGRTGTIPVRAGSLVQPTSAPLVTVTQVNPIQVSFTLPERELGGPARRDERLRGGRERAARGRGQAEGPPGVPRQLRGQHHRHDPREGRIRQRQGPAVAGHVRERRGGAAHAHAGHRGAGAGGADRARQPLHLRGRRRRQGRAAHGEGAADRRADRGRRGRAARRPRGDRGRAEPAARQHRRRSPARRRAREGRREERQEGDSAEKGA
jgi:RND family efflux transporter MFP subunit